MLIVSVTGLSDADRLLTGRHHLFGLLLSAALRNKHIHKLTLINYNPQLTLVMFVFRNVHQLRGSHLFAVVTTSGLLDCQGSCSLMSAQWLTCVILNCKIILCVCWIVCPIWCWQSYVPLLSSKCELSPFGQVMLLKVICLILCVIKKCFNLWMSLFIFYPSK